MGQYFDNAKLSSNMQKYDVIIKNCKLTLFLDNGVFSKSKLDFGTRLLLETIPLDNISGDILDVGCGYGPIGLFLAKMTDSNVDMCDVNKRALHLSLIASKFNKLKNVNIFESNCYSSVPTEKKYDVIITTLFTTSQSKLQLIMKKPLLFSNIETLYIFSRSEIIDLAPCSLRITKNNLPCSFK